MMRQWDPDVGALTAPDPSVDAVGLTNRLAAELGHRPSLTVESDGTVLVDMDSLPDDISKTDVERVLEASDPRASGPPFDTPPGRR